MKLWKMFYTTSGNIVVMAETAEAAKEIAEDFSDEIFSKSDASFFSITAVEGAEELPSGFRGDSKVYCDDLELTVDSAIEYIREKRAQEEFERRQLKLFKAG